MYSICSISVQNKQMRSSHSIQMAPWLTKRRRYHTTHDKFKIILCLLFQYIQVSHSRSWMDAIDPSKLINDGMPRVLPPSRNKTTPSTTNHNDEGGVQMTNPHNNNNNNNAISKHQSQSTTIKEVKITIQGSTTTLFTEVNPYRITSEPSVSPSTLPSYSPSTFPSSSPTSTPSYTPTISSLPTSTPSYSPTSQPTSSPNYNTAPIPSNPKAGYFNYEPTSPYGPSQWSKITSLSKLDAGYYFHKEYDLGDSAIKDLSDFNRNGGDKGGNDCGSNKKQSPIDVCVRPKDSCTETHEMRPKSGDYKMNEELITKQILSNKLRLIMTPRTGEEPDPPQIDFSSNGRGIIDMTNIDFKFPSEHSVCGMKFHGEMQYFTYHPIRKRFVAVSFFLDGSEGNPKNEHLQEVIDAFKVIYKEDERKCNQRRSESEANSFASGFGGNNKRRMMFDEKDLIMNGNTTSSILDYENDGETDIREGSNSTTSSQQQRRLALKWHPFHPDIQKTVHFWGYSGSFTDPPCTRDIVDWKIMDVPTPISSIQLQQLKHLLYTHVDEKCRRTSVHNSQGSVARPTQPTLKYYKCTRDDYVSDEERAICGDDGCADHWFGAGLNPYYPPLVDVTGPPTRSPSK